MGNKLNFSEKRTQFLLAGTSPDGLILRSLNRGKTWSNLGSLGKGNPTSFCKLSNGDVLYGTDAGWVVNYTVGISVQASYYGITTINTYGTDIAINDLNGDFSYCLDAQTMIFTFNKHFSYPSNTFLEDVGTWFTSNGIYLWGMDEMLVQSGDFTCAIDVGNGFVYAGTSNGHIWRNTTINDFATWTDLGDKTGDGYTIYSIALCANGRILYHPQSYSIYYTDDEFSTVQSSSGGIDPVSTHINAIKYTENNIVIGAGDNGELEYSTDNGSTFINIGQQYLQTSINCLI